MSQIGHKEQFKITKLLSEPKSTVEYPMDETIMKRDLKGTDTERRIWRIVRAEVLDTLWYGIGERIAEPVKTALGTHKVPGPGVLLYDEI